MATTKEDIKNWLERTGRDRQWLGDQCGASKNTVNNWLSTSINVPSKALRIIENLMQADREVDKAKDPAPPLSLVLEVDAQSFDAYNRASLSHGMIIRDWAIDVLNKAAARDAMEAAASKTVPFVAGSRAAEEPAVYGKKRIILPLTGTVAAGGRMVADLVESEIEVGKQYPVGCYALRVMGKSMEPDIPHESVIIVKPWTDGYPKKGSVVVYNDGHGATLKVYQTEKTAETDDNGRAGKRPVLLSINPDFPQVEPMDGGRIVATLVEVL